MFNIIYIIFIYFFIFNNSFSQENNAPNYIDNCISDICKEIQINNIKIDGHLKYIKESESDTRSFKDTRIYSLETEKIKLLIPLIKSIGLTIQFYPGKGYFEIKKPGFKQVFDFGNTYSQEKDYCRKYYIRVIDASSSHMVLEKYCTPFEIMKGIYEQNVSYILYDMNFAEMKIIYLYTTYDDIKYPFIANDPNIIKIKNGYKLSWSFKTKKDEFRWDINKKYLRKININKKQFLGCDPTNKIVDANYEGVLCSFGTFNLVYKSN
ncbi:hypothetical protein RGU70_05755 [Herbaspirillum sp. RTI4]|uniref:hypothetical protein n=1 Tax=Herbaspirillum sp. RTI4 TaxID=3048640 RepID=UPI002AB48A0B|nr:hypothetical protein [Herbaspirillum sp. RTI4]MDY7577823.1 hypothetical protein [Herbaspirillum sp. RTI4]